MYRGAQYVIAKSVEEEGHEGRVSTCIAELCPVGSYFDENY